MLRESKTHNPLIEGAHMNKVVLEQHSIESLVTYVFTPHLKAHDGS